MLEACAHIILEKGGAGVGFGATAAAGVDPHHGLVRPIERALAGHLGNSRIDGLAGILPEQIDKVLQWSSSRGSWVRAALSVTQDRMDMLQATLLEGSRRIWGARCRKMDRWWFSPAGAAARGALRDGFIGRAGTRASKNLNPAPCAPPPRLPTRARPTGSPRAAEVSPRQEVSSAVARALRKLQGTNARGDREGDDRDLPAMRAEAMVKAADPGFVITDDRQLAAEVAEIECADRIDCKTERLRLYWY